MGWKLPWSPAGIPSVLDPQAVQDNFKAIEERLTALGVERAPLTVMPAASPALEGRDVTFLADAANGVVWRFKCRYAGNGSSYKWEFQGGGSLYTSTSGAVNLSTVGANTALTGDLALTVPLAGDYDVQVSATAFHTGNNQGIYLFPTGAGYTGSGIGEGASYCVQPAMGSPNAAFPMNGNGRLTGLTAGGTLNLGYFVGAAGAQLTAKRSLRITPVRVQ